MRRCRQVADLGVVASFTRPRVPDDNPYSEAQFKTPKYHPASPDRFGSEVHAGTWGQQIFHWYNFEHYHSGLGLMTPAVVHFGQAPAIATQRQQVLHQVYLAHPEPFVRSLPKPPAVPAEVWINSPSPAETARPDTQELQ